MRIKPNRSLRVLLAFDHIIVLLAFDHIPNRYKTSRVDYNYLLFVRLCVLIATQKDVLYTYLHSLAQIFSFPEHM